MKKRFFSFLKWKSIHVRLKQPRNGQTLVEYALIIAALAIVMVVVLSNLEKQTSSLYSGISAQINATSVGS